MVLSAFVRPRFIMPFYAVARGWKVGVYEKYDECFKNIKGFPKARFKKFNTTQEAEEFIKECSNESEASTVVVCPENAKPAPSFKIGKVSPSNVLEHSLNKRLAALEEKLDKFISNVNDKIDSLVNRINVLERKRGIDEVEHENEKEKKVKLEENVQKPEEDEHNFQRTQDGLVIVYTDGACSKNGKAGAKAGIGVWFGESHPLNVSAPVRGPPTNNTAEIQAARIAITQAQKANVRQLSLYTDSQFMINCITKWIHRWKKNNWTLSTGGLVKNKDELIRLDEAIQSLDKVEWHYIPGHSGHLGNEMADKLARKGAEKYKSNVTYSAAYISDVDDIGNWTDDWDDKT